MLEEKCDLFPLLSPVETDTSGRLMACPWLGEVCLVPASDLACMSVGSSLCLPHAFRNQETERRTGKMACRDIKKIFMPSGAMSLG